MNRQEQIRARRRVAVRVGLAMLIVLTATACIYEKSSYQGGGRIDQGGEAKTAEPTSTATEPTPTATSTDDSAPPNPLQDAGGG